jgi:hypothetical protein
MHGVDGIFVLGPGEDMIARMPALQIIAVSKKDVMTVMRSACPIEPLQSLDSSHFGPAAASRQSCRRLLS